MMDHIWGAIYPDGKSKKKGTQQIKVRVIEYTIDVDEQQRSLPSDYQFNGYCFVSGFIACDWISTAMVKAKVRLMKSLLI